MTAVASPMIVLDALLVSTALSTMRVDLHASVQRLEWTVNAYTVRFAVLLMTGAALGDRFGRRRVFCIGLGLFAAASAGCALSPDVGWLIAILVAVFANTGSYASPQAFIDGFVPATAVCASLAALAALAALSLPGRQIARAIDVGRPAPAPRAEMNVYK